MSKIKVLKETLFDRKVYQSLTEFADDLELIAKKLREEATVTFKEGEKETLIQPSNDVKVEYKYETRDTRHKFEIELKWDTDSKGSFSIE